MLLSRLLVVLLALVSVLLGGPPLDAGEYGVRCQRNFDDPKLAKLEWAGDNCNGFAERMSGDGNVQTFYYGMKGGTGFTSNDGKVGNGGVDTVDVFFVGTHGGISSSSNDAILALKPKNAFAFSTQWRFGDNSNQVAIFSQYACQTLFFDDSKMHKRWRAPFRGGLYIATGSHGFLIDSWETSEAGYDYATNLGHGMSIRWAWFDGLWDHWFDQDVAAAGSGSDKANCKSRRNGMDGQNVNGYSRLRDADVGFICVDAITDY